MTLTQSDGVPRDQANAKQNPSKKTGLDSEPTKSQRPLSPTPSWRKPDPSQWRYPSYW